MGQASLIPADERQHWSHAYELGLHRAIVKSIAYVAACQRKPERLIPHLSSFLALLNQARLYPALYSNAIDLIDALHPWPTRWGYWDEWEKQIRFTIHVLQEQQNASCPCSGLRDHFQLKAQQDNLGRQARFMNYLAGILFHTSRIQDTRQVCEQAIELARASQDPVTLAQLSHILIPLFLDQGDLAAAETCLHVLEDVVSELMDKHRPTEHQRCVATSWLDLQRINVLRHRRCISDAQYVADVMIQRLESLPDTDQFLLAEAFNLRGIVEWMQTNYSAAITDVKKAQTLFMQQGDLYYLASVTGNLGQIYLGSGDLNDAEATARECIKMTERLNASWRLVMAMAQLCVACLGKGHLEQARSYCEHCIALDRRLHYPVYEMYDRTNRGIIRLHLGEYEQARQDLETMCPETEKRGYIRSAICGWSSLSRCYAALGLHIQAMQTAQHTFELSAREDVKGLHTIALRCLAELQAPDQQQALWQQALDLAQVFNRRLDQAACLLALSKLTPVSARRMQLWEQGCYLLREIGAEVWLQGCSPDHPPQLPFMA